MSSRIAEATETTSDAPESLLARFENVDVVFDEIVLAKPTSAVFHRLDHDARDKRPACASCPPDENLQVTTPQATHRKGLDPCRKCYEPIFEYLATEPESPVESRTQPVEIEEVAYKDVEAFEPVRPRPEPDPLLGVTDKVMITSRSKVMHAPQPQGPLCSKSGDYRCVNRTAVEGHYRPCKNCFLIDDE